MSVNATDSGIDRAHRAASRIATDARLLVFPVVAAVGCTAALATVFFAVRPVLGELVSRYGLTGVSWFGIVAVLPVVGYTLCALVITFSNAGLVWASAQVVRGESVRLREAAAVVWQHKRQLLSFGLVAGVVGSVLGVLERRIQFVSKLTVAILGAGYTVVSFFVVPAVILDGATTSEMFTRSFELVRANATETVVLSLGVVATFGFVGGLPIFILVVIVIAGEVLTLGAASAIETNILFFGSVGIVLFAGGLLIGSSPPARTHRCSTRRPRQLRSPQSRRPASPIRTARLSTRPRSSIYLQVRPRLVDEP